MKLVSKDLKQGIVRVAVDTPDDMWVLSQLISPGDIVESRTFRKIKLEGDRKSEIIKKPVVLSLRVERADFATDLLRVSGVIVEGPDDVPRGSHHTISVDDGSVLSITKQVWHSFELERLEEACSAKVPPVLVCVLDREEAFIASLKKYGHNVLAHLRGEVAKKSAPSVAKDFYAEVVESLQEYDARLAPERIVIASPAFWKDELVKSVRDARLRSKFVLATVSSVDERALDEAISRDETKLAVQQARSAQELRVVQEWLGAIARQGAAVYGLVAVEQAALSGAVATLLVSDGFVRKSRDHGVGLRLDAVFRAVDSGHGKIVIVSEEHESGRRVAGLGGIGALLRYRVS